MDTKLKSSRKQGIIAAAVLLVFCSLMMLRTYPAISDYLENESSQDVVYQETLYQMSNALAEGNYILYNEYAKETDPGQVLSEFGQRKFDLVRKYMDCDVFASENSEGDSTTEEISGDVQAEKKQESSSDEENTENGLDAVLGNTTEQIQKELTARETEHYAFRAVYTFSAEGQLSGVKVDGTKIDSNEAYELENALIREAKIEEESYGIASIATPSQVTLIYGMTEENLAAYAKANNSNFELMYSIEYFGAYRDSVEVLGILVVLAALLFPLRRKLDLSNEKIFRVPFEIPVLVLLFCLGSQLWLIPQQIVYNTLSDNLLPGEGGGLELLEMLINFLMWVIVFGILFWAVTSLRAMIRMKGAYWRERTLTARVVRHIRRKGDEDKLKKKAESIFRRVKNFFVKQYDALLHLDFQDRTNKTILKVVILNFVILVIVCCFWFYGVFALILYSVLLFLFLRKYTRDLQDKYKLLLKSTNQLAEGHLDVPIEGDIGLFNPIQDELKKIQKGFKKAVDEEVKNERMKTELVTNVSHDLRTPLTAIITYTDLLKNEKDEEKRKEYIEVLERKSLRLKVLIEDLFEISKAASKSVAMHFMKVDIVNLLKEVGLENDTKIKKANLEFKWKLPEQKIVMWLDSQKTYRIFENLIVNITKYAMPHTRVYIELTERENSVHISMKNVSAAELNFNTDEITDRFVRGDSSRNTEGSGLGLAIAKSFVELQHGTLKITTEADLFKADITLPKIEIPPQDESVKEQSVQP